MSTSLITGREGTSSSALELNSNTQPYLLHDSRYVTVILGFAAIKVTRLARIIEAETGISNVLTKIRIVRITRKMQTIWKLAYDPNEPALADIAYKLNLATPRYHWTIRTWKPFKPKEISE